MRGRAVQSVMHDGKEKRVELISEMRSTHALQAAQQQLLEDRMQATRLLQQQQQSDQLKVGLAWLGAVTVACQTYDWEVAGSNPGRVTIKRLLILGWVTVYD